MKKNLALKISLSLLLLTIVGIFISSYSMAATSETAKITGKYNYDYARQVLDIVNQERAKVNKPALKMTKGLFDAANQRAAELAVTYDSGHRRPDESICFTAFPQEGTMMGENIAMGQTTPAMVMNDWMHSEGHMRNILGLDYDYTTIGIGCFEKDGILHWVQCFGNAGTELTSYPANATKTVTVPVKPGSVEYILASNKTVEKGKNITLTIQGKHAVTGAFKDGEISFDCDNTDFTWASKDESIATVVNGKVTGKKAGTTIITATIGSKKLECTVKVAPVLEKIEITTEIDELEVGTGTPFGISYLPLDSINHPDVTWESSDPSIATVIDGMVKGIKPGKATITAKAGNFTATHEITIVAATETNPEKPGAQNPSVTPNPEKPGTTPTPPSQSGTTTTQPGQSGTTTEPSQSGTDKPSTTPDKTDKVDTGVDDKTNGKDNTNKKEQGNKGKLDNEPKTGNNAYQFIGTVLVISALGAVICTKKLYK